jgi:beta-lactamase class C
LALCGDMVLSKKIFALATVCAGLVSSPLSASEDAAIAGFDKKFQLSVEKNNVPGAAYAIVHNGKIVRARGHGMRALGAELPVTSDTVFRLASVSKTFSAELAAMLVAEGKFGWDDPLHKYVPAFKVKTPGHAAKLKVGNLLSHTTGLTPNAYDNMLEDGWSLDKIMPRFRQLKPMCKPGACYGYQNIAYSFIEPVIERSTGQDFHKLMESRIFAPLSMKSSSIGLEGYLSSSNRAEPHKLTRRGWYRTIVKSNYYNVAPAAGVNASVMDLAKWIRAQLGYDAEVLSPELIKTVTEKRVRTVREKRKRAWRSVLKNAHYGYGWRIYDLGDEEIVMHGGGVSGFRSLIAYSPTRDIGLVILMNAETRSIDKLGADFWATAIKSPAKRGAAKSAR